MSSKNGQLVIDPSGDRFSGLQRNQRYPYPQPSVFNEAQEVKNGSEFIRTSVFRGMQIKFVGGIRDEDALTIHDL